MGAEQKEVLLTANYIVSDVAGARAAGTLADIWLQETQNADRMRQLIQLIAKGELSSRGAKETLAYMFVDARAPQDIAGAYGLVQQSDEVRSLKLLSRWWPRTPL